MPLLHPPKKPAHMSQLALDSLRVSAGHFLFGIMKQLFSKIYIELASKVQYTLLQSARKSNEMLYKCTEAALMATHEVILPAVPERIHECVEK